MKLTAKIMHQSIDELDVSARIINCLKNAEINLISEVVTKTEAELLKTQNFSRIMIKQLKDALSRKGLTLA